MTDYVQPERKIEEEKQVRFVSPAGRTDGVDSSAILEEINAKLYLLISMRKREVSDGD